MQCDSQPQPRWSFGMRNHKRIQILHRGDDLLTHQKMEKRRGFQIGRTQDLIEVLKIVSQEGTLITESSRPLVNTWKKNYPADFGF